MQKTLRNKDVCVGEEGGGGVHDFTLNVTVRYMGGGGGRSFFPIFCVT